VQSFNLQIEGQRLKAIKEEDEIDACDQFLAKLWHKYYFVAIK
jgi:hypothetical protein